MIFILPTAISPFSPGHLLHLHLCKNYTCYCVLSTITNYLCPPASLIYPRTSSLCRVHLSMSILLATYEIPKEEIPDNIWFKPYGLAILLSSIALAKGNGKTICRNMLTNYMQDSRLLPEWLTTTSKSELLRLKRALRRHGEWGAAASRT